MEKYLKNIMLKHIHQKNKTYTPKYCVCQTDFVSKNDNTYLSFLFIVTF